MSPTDPKSSSWSVAAGERSPRLVLLFAVFTALGVSAAAAAILMVIRYADTASAQAAAGDRARYAARAVLAPALRPSDLISGPSAKRRRQLDRVLHERVLIEGLRAATLYRSDGRRVYSGVGDRESDPSASAHVREALSGSTVSVIATATDGSRVLRTYVPIAHAGKEGAGVVRLDQEYEPIAAAVRRSSFLVAGILEGLLLLLFLALVPALARASARIRAHVAELERVATHDEVTGLLNRNGFRRRAEARLAEEDSAAVLLVDLDGFSEIGSSLGSASGDRLLAEVADRLRRELVPEGALVGLVGEDEFGVVYGPADHAEAQRIAERVARIFEAPFVVDGVRLAVGVDIGAGLFPEHGPDVDAVVTRASAALQAAKTDDRGGIEVYGPAHSASDHNRLAVAAQLRDGLTTGQLRVFYQPQADFLTHQIRGVEALLRWEHPERGLLPASEFIAHAERSGLAQEVRRFVVAEAALQWQQWRMQGYELELAINLSALDMLDPALPDELELATTLHDLPPGNLVLEITERALIAEERRARRTVERLDELGVRLAVDDFGTGFSSLASLRMFPISQVKLDRSLLADVPGDEGAEAIVGGSVEIAHGLGALVVAEGIETPAQWRFACTMGCDIAQGYLIGKPMPGNELLGVLDVPRLAPVSAA